MDILERLLEHDAWTTRQLLLACRDVSAADLAKRFEIGPGSLVDTFDHIIGSMERWADRIADRPQSAARADGGRDGAPGDVAALLKRLDAAAADLRAVAIEVAGSGRLDETMQVVAEGRPYAFTRGTAIVHVATHGMHHRAQVLNMLRHLGVRHDVDGDAIEWEIRRRRGGSRA